MKQEENMKKKIKEKEEGKYFSGVGDVQKIKSYTSYKLDLNKSHDEQDEEESHHDNVRDRAIVLEMLKIFFPNLFQSFSLMFSYLSFLFYFSVYDFMKPK